MEKILISACLLGEPVRYNGGVATSGDARLAQWVGEGRVVAFCPEVAGGLGTPRPRAERQVLRVITDAGADVTDAFLRGATLARETARQHGIRVAILKDGSPSCGSGYVYDGSFTGRTVPGVGLTTEMLERDGVRVFSERQIDDAAACLASLESQPAAPEPRRGEGG
jgi:uncharacterized protein YbbK (DUF523 family)